MYSFAAACDPCTPLAVIGPRRLGPLKERKVYRHIWLGSDCCRKIMQVKILVARNPCFNIFPGMPKGASKSETFRTVLPWGTDHWRVHFLLLVVMYGWFAAFARRMFR